MHAILLACLLGASPKHLAETKPTIVAKESTLPGISRTQKAEQPNLLALRDAVSTWYCAPKSSRLTEAPCVVHSTLNAIRNAKDKTEAERDSVYMQAMDTASERIDRQTAKSQFQKMFVIYCAEASSHPSFNDVCSNPTIRHQYKLS